MLGSTPFRQEAQRGGLGRRPVGVGHARGGSAEFGGASPLEARGPFPKIGLRSDGFLQRTVHLPARVATSLRNWFGPDLAPRNLAPLTRSVDLGTCTP